MKFTLYTANCTGNAQNSLYPNRAVIANEADMMTVAARDHVCAKYKNCHRSSDDYISGDVDVMDCDNDHSDNTADWITPQMYEELFPDVSYIVVPSRNDGKVKGSKSARPRHHVYFPHEPIKNSAKCAELKSRIHEIAPFLDGHALDAARFIFGHNADDITWHEGSRTITEFLDEMDFVDFDKESENISEGSRNNTMSRIAGRLIKRYGNTEKAYEVYTEKAQRCTPPLSDDELNNIWHSAVKFGNM